jgi:hypothetical protein
MKRFLMFILVVVEKLSSNKVVFKNPQMQPKKTENRK